MIKGRFNINQSFYELGCGPGALVYYARQQGIEAYGVDVSQYAVDWGDQMFPGVSQWITVQDAYSWLTGQKRNAHDVCISRGFICCFDESPSAIESKRITNLVSELNRVFRSQIHVITNVPAEAYIRKTAAEWRDSFDWATGTYFVPDSQWNNWVRK